MKKFLLLLSVALLFASTGCKKDKDDDGATIDNQAVVVELFKAGMTWNTAPKMYKSWVPVNIEVEDYIFSPYGGNIHVIGSVTGNMEIDDNTQQILGGTLLLGLTETINDYTLMSNGKEITMNGAPYMSLSGTFTLQQGGTFGTASSMTIGGGLRITGERLDHTMNIQITIIINSDGSGGMVSGTIDGRSVNFSF